VTTLSDTNSQDRSDTSKPRTPAYLSPSALSCWEGQPDEALYRYIVPKDVRPAKPPQTDPMSVGSAFDALVKAEISNDLFGAERTEATGYRRRDLIAKQCEEHTLPKSLELACICFDQYVRCGAYGNLIAQIQQSSVDARMEFDVTKVVGGVPLLGKPDLHFHTNLHAHVITDWKVSGSCSVHGVSAQQGFQLSLDCQGSRTHGLPHSKYKPVMHAGGIFVNGLKMNDTTDYWADQLATYAWCLDEPVGEENFIARIEQLACRTTKEKELKNGTVVPAELRVKSVVHQSTVDGDYQNELLERYQRVWHHVSTGHYFADLSRPQSDARANMLTRALTHPSAGDAANMSVGTIPAFDFGS